MRIRPFRFANREGDMTNGIRHPKYVAGAVAAALALVVGGVALGAQLSSSVTSVTGCLSQSGDLTKFAAGDSPLKSCTGSQVQVHLTGDDLASIVAGTGLDGSTANGVTTLSINPAYALPQGCAFYQVARWNGANWFCSDAVAPLP
jgi:hypothetical protein